MPREVVFGIATMFDQMNTCAAVVSGRGKAIVKMRGNIDAWDVASC
jgi:hypothetical protein